MKYACVCVLTDILKEYVWAKRKVESTEQQCLFILTAGLHTCSLLWYHCKHVAGLTGRMAHLKINDHFVYLTGL